MTKRVPIYRRVNKYESSTQKDRCRASVSHGRMGLAQCTRKGMHAWEQEGETYLLCRQHHPTAGSDGDVTLYAVAVARPWHPDGPQVVEVTGTLRAKTFRVRTRTEPFFESDTVNRVANETEGGPVTRAERGRPALFRDPQSALRRFAARQVEVAKNHRAAAKDADAAAKWARAQAKEYDAVGK